MPAAAEFAVRADQGARTIGEARRAWAGQLRSQGIESAELDARVLTGHALGLDHAGLAAADGRQINVDEHAAIAALVERRLAREPVARILGCKEFWSLSLCIDASTLVPRPETETVVEAALAAAEAGGAGARPMRVADLGTGSGAILLALLHELPDGLGVGTDTSLAALSVARRNAHRLGIDRARFLSCDMASALRGPFDLIVSNPPYIASADIAALAPEVRDFDPPAALDGGPDGLRFYRAIAAAATALLAPTGSLVVELGAGQVHAVAALLAAAGLTGMPPCRDLGGIPRALIAKKMS